MSQIKNNVDEENPQYSEEEDEKTRKIRLGSGDDNEEERIFLRPLLRVNFSDVKDIGLIHLI